MKRIECPLRPDPWGRDHRNALPVLVTGSAIRRETARGCGIPPFFQDFQGRAEERTKARMGGNGAVTDQRRGPSSPPLPVELATDKARELLGSLLKSQRLELGGPSSFATVDSTWGVDFTPHNPWYIEDTRLFHKPSGGKDVEWLIIQTFHEGVSQGAHLQSISGVCVVSRHPDGRNDYHQSLMVVDFGPLNPMADWQKFANLIQANGNYAAGISTGHLFHDIRLAEMPPFVSVHIFDFGRRDNSRIPSGPSGSFVHSRSTLELGAHPENLPAIIALSLGLIPKR